ncbi:MAG: NAD(P)/FAD-dependent oxidoreductase [Dehalococcoidia bacterium]|nr:NAD(P)/FAD-dependent oxidoreductase [Dehalococcoidia bacterium]MDW8119950.1 NAD(P)/FAD-dependent oxidoreductase [Chloroflexota bacterium]
MRVGIIGGGAAGLAAAYELVRQGHQAVVFERATFLGGQASTFTVGGARLERGYHHLFTSDVDMVWLIREVGLGQRLAWIPSKVGLFYGGRIWNFTTPTDLLRFAPLTLPQRLRLGLISLSLQRYRNWRALEPYTATQRLPRLVGQRPYEVVWEPLLRGKFGRHYQEIGLAWFWGKIALRFASRGRLMAQERLGYPMGSFGEVFDIVGEQVTKHGGQVHLATAVRRVLVDGERAVGLEVDSPNGTRQEAFDAIIATVPSFIFPRLVPSLPSAYLERLTGVTYLAAVLIVLVLRRPLSSIYWLNIADRSIPFVAIIEHTNYIPPQHYGGKHIVYISNYLDKNDPLARMSHHELLETYLPHLRRLNPAFDPSWIEESYYHREEAAQPIITTHYSRRIPSHRTPIKGLYLANTTQIYPEDRGTNYSVRLGRKVARMLLKDYGLPVQGKLPRPAIPDSITSAEEWA